MNTKSLKYFIYTFAIIGFVSILSSFNSQPENQQSCSTIPESHVWEISNDSQTDTYMWNKKTGEVRFLSGGPTDPKKGKYWTLTEENE